LCKFFMSGECPNSSAACPFAHSAGDLRITPLFAEKLSRVREAQKKPGQALQSGWLVDSNENGLVAMKPGKVIRTLHELPTNSALSQMKPTDSSGKADLHELPNMMSIPCAMLGNDPNSSCSIMTPTSPSQFEETLLPVLFDGPLVSVSRDVIEDFLKNAMPDQYKD